MKKLILLIFFAVISLLGFSQVDQYTVRARLQLKTDSIFVVGTDTLIRTFDGTGYVFTNVRTAVDSLDAVNLAQLVDSLNAMNTTLGGLTDVDTTGKQLDYGIFWNGTKWVTEPKTSTSSSGGIQFYMDDTEIIPVSINNTYPVKTLSKFPITTAEDVGAISVVSNTVPYGAYLYNTALGGTTIDAGIWTFNTYASVSSTLAARVSSITRNIYLVKAGSGTLTITGTGTSRTATASSGTPFVSGDATATIGLGGHIQTPLGLFKITAFTSATAVTIAVPTTYTT